MISLNILCLVMFRASDLRYVCYMSGIHTQIGYHVLLSNLYIQLRNCFKQFANFTDYKRNLMINNYIAVLEVKLQISIVLKLHVYGASVETSIHSENR